MRIRETTHKAYSFPPNNLSHSRSSSAVNSGSPSLRCAFCCTRRSCFANSSEEFAKQLQRVHPAAQRKEGEQALTPEEIREWLKLFGGKE